MNELKCIGCGAVLQSNDETGIGFVNKSVLQSNRDDLLCKRCFKLTHYNEVLPVSLDENDYIKILHKIDKLDVLIVMMIDIFDYSGSIIPGIVRMTGNNDLLLFGNKYDLLPKSVKPNKVKHWLRYMLAQDGIKPIDVSLISAHKNFHIDEAIDLIEKYRKGRDVYIVGATNVGKSSFLNALLKSYSGAKKDVITVSMNPGTTLGTIEIPLDDKSYIVDTPGLINTSQIGHYLQRESLKKITPKKEIEPKIYQLNPDQTLFLAGMARVDFVSGNPSSFVCYFAHGLHIHRTKTINADEVYRKNLGTLLSPPTNDELDAFLDTTKSVFNITAKEKQEIVFCGLGFISVVGNAKVVVSHPQKVAVYLRKAII